MSVFVRSSTVAGSLAVAALVILGTLSVGSRLSEGQQPESQERAKAFLLSAGDHPEEWRTIGGRYDEQRFSELDQINESNVGRLGLAWAYDTGTIRGLEATPLVVGGTLYATLTWSQVVALDAKTGEKKWEFDPEIDRAYGRRACCDVVNRGVAYYDEKIYVGVLDGRLAALDAYTGEPAWEVVTVDQNYPYTITGAPRVIDGKVIIGNGGAEYGVRGYVSAYDAATGELVWRFYTVPGNPADGFENDAMKMAAETWTGEWWTMGGGGTAWDSMAYDPELDLLYIGTGNGSPWNREIRSPGGGDNLFLSSIVALRPDTGEYVWHFQTTPGDSWDFTATQHIVLADLEIEGRLRKVLMQAPKNGFFFVLDRETGEFISANNYVPVTWASGVDPETGRPIEVEGARYEEKPFLLQPSALGGHNWHPMAFNPKTGLVYIPAQVNHSYRAQPESFEFVPEAWNTGVGRAVMPAEMEAKIEAEGGARGHLLAWDPVKQEESWRVEHPLFWNGGVLTTAGNLVFQASSDRRFVAYRATDGKELWAVPTPTSAIAAPSTYAIDETQYVALAVGWGGAFGLGRGDAVGGGRGGWILAFALAGSADLPDRASGSRLDLTPIEFESTPQQLARGEELYEQRCAVCHRVAGSGEGVLPDLRYSAKRVFDNYDQIVREGRFIERGMPAMGAWMNSEDVAAVRTFILRQRELLLAEP